MSEKKMNVGSDAPDFVLKDHNGKEFKLSQFRGKKVLLSFHPLAWTPVCANQMKSLEENYDKFEQVNAVAVGISIDSSFSKHAWAKELGIEKTPLLADFWPHGEVAKKYNIFREQDGFSERANIIVDESGKIMFYKVYEISTLPDIEEILEALK